MFPFDDVIMRNSNMVTKVPADIQVLKDGNIIKNGVSYNDD